MTDSHRDSKLSVYWAFSDISVEVSEWTDTQDSDSHMKRSDIVYAVIHNRSTTNLRVILDSGWDVNEVLNMDLFATEPPCKTALQIAARCGWTEGVKLLFDAGASYMVPGMMETPLELALHNRNCPVDIIELLLRNGANPNHYMCAGANNMPSGVLETPLQLALGNPKCPVAIIDILMKYGADPNQHSSWFNQIPLGQALLGFSQCNEDFQMIVQLLLENGADPNVTGKLNLDAMGNLPLGRKVWLPPTLACPLSAALVVLVDSASKLLKYAPDGSPLNVDEVRRLSESNAKIFKTLVQFGADVNWNVDETEPLLRKVEPMLHKIVVNLQKERLNNSAFSLYLHGHLDVFFQNGGNINLEDGDYGTALEYAVRKYGHSNSVRWLIRHGADITPFMFTLLKYHLIPDCFSRSSPTQQIEETPLILLQAGMRVSCGTVMHLINIEEEISTWQAQSPAHKGTETHRVAFDFRVRAMWRLVKEEMKAFGKSENYLRKHTFPKYLSTQMADLEEFSDEALLADREIVPESGQTKDELEFALDQIHSVLGFLGQTQSLQWYCRRCVRENLVSLQPSVVKTLPVPARLKRYILCHDI